MSRQFVVSVKTGSRSASRTSRIFYHTDFEGVINKLESCNPEGECIVRLFLLESRKYAYLYRGNVAHVIEQIHQDLETHGTIDNILEHKPWND